MKKLQTLLNTIFPQKYRQKTKDLLCMMIEGSTWQRIMFTSQTSSVKIRLKIVRVSNEFLTDFFFDELVPTESYVRNFLEMRFPSRFPTNFSVEIHLLSCTKTF